MTVLTPKHSRHTFIVNILSGITFYYYRDTLFVFYDHSNKDDKAFFFLTNLILFIAKFHIHQCKFKQ